MEGGAIGQRKPLECQEEDMLVGCAYTGHSCHFQNPLTFAHYHLLRVAWAEIDSLVFSFPNFVGKGMLITAGRSSVLCFIRMNT